MGRAGLNFIFFQSKLNFPHPYESVHGQDEDQITVIDCTRLTQRKASAWILMLGFLFDRSPHICNSMIFRPQLTRVILQTSSNAFDCDREHVSFQI